MSVIETSNIEIYKIKINSSRRRKIISVLSNIYKDYDGNTFGDWGKACTQRYLVVFSAGQVDFVSVSKDYFQSDNVERINYRELGKLIVKHLVQLR